jgi:hypothetical protein
MDGLVDRLVRGRGVRGRRIVEVGCGKGAFLHKVVAADEGNRGWGFDPSYVGPDTQLDGRLVFERRFYGADSARLRAEVVVCRHVIEHVVNPVGLLRAVREAVATSPTATVFFETPCAEWILRNRVVWDFFYEHCSLFTRQSLTRAFAEASFRVTSVEHVFGGQYLWLEAKPVAERPVGLDDPGDVPALARDFAQSEAELKNRLAAALERLRSRGGVALWGAGAKGATLAHLLDPDRRRIRCLVDINPRKQGRFVPGSGHPIIAPHALGQYGVSSVLVMNPLYRTEVSEQLAATGQRAEIQLAEEVA